MMLKTLSSRITTFGGCSFFTATLSLVQGQRINVRPCRLACLARLSCRMLHLVHIFRRLDSLLLIELVDHFLSRDVCISSPLELQKLLPVYFGSHFQELFEVHSEFYLSPFRFDIPLNQPCLKVLAWQYGITSRPLETCRHEFRLGDHILGLRFLCSITPVLSALVLRLHPLMIRVE